MRSAEELRPAIARMGSYVSEDHADGTIGAIGEHQLIAKLRERLPANGPVLIGAGDDAALLAAPDGRVVVSTDVLVEGRHFRRDWSSAADVGTRAAAANLADIVAMGAAPRALLVTLVAPGDLPVGWVLDLADGISAEAGLVGAQVAGGDLSAGDSITVGLTALGDLEGRDPVTRAGARAGDVVAVAGRFGWAAAGLALLSRGFRSPRAIVDAHRRPQPPYLAGIEAAVAGATAMIDVSDGLLADLGHVAQESAVRIELESALLPRDESLAAAASAFSQDPLVWVLGGGDDHGLAATFPPHVSLPAGFRAVGRVAEGDPGVLVDGAVPAVPVGFDHFR